MKKIPMLFALEFNDDNGNRIITDRINEKAAFILEREDAIPTIKIDGTAVKLDEKGNWFARRNVKRGKKAPIGFILEEEDMNTGNRFGWEPIEQSPFVKFFHKAIKNFPEELFFTPGTYELIGPKIQGNPENVPHEMLIMHGTVRPQEKMYDFPTMAEIRDHVHKGTVKEFLRPFFQTFRNNNVEGIVWWVDDVPVVKLRAVDFFPEMDTRNN